VEKQVEKLESGVQKDILNDFKQSEPQLTLVKDIGRLIQTITRKTMKPRESRGYMDIWVTWQV
jgi:hypothetical protein